MLDESIASTIAVSLTAVAGSTDCVSLDVVVTVVLATTWKHSSSAVVELEARKLLVSGV